VSGDADGPNAFDPLELAPGLWRWAAPHPEWHSGSAPGSTGDWERRVGSVGWRSETDLVFVDALIPEDDEAFWRWADELASGAARIHALTTISFHRRSRERLVDRYGAATSRARGGLPDGIEPVPLSGAGEVDFWITKPSALITGDRILGASQGGLRLCPPSWLGYLSNGMTLDGVRELLRPLLDLPIEMVLVAHGEPVLSDGRQALAEALG